MKLKKKNCLIALIIILLIIFEIINPIQLVSSYSLKKLNYSTESSKTITSLGIKKQVLEHEYSEFVDKNVQSKYFIVDNYDIYRQLNYNISFNNVDIINRLIDKGYDVEEINCVINTGDVESANELLKKEKYEYIVDFLSFDYAKLKNLDRYIEYQKNTLSNFDETVLYVELNLDKEFYTDYNVINDFSFDMLVNKYNQLSENYEPVDLIKVDGKYSVSDDNYGNKTMLDNFYKMADDLNKDLNLNIYVRSAYRTFKSQQEVYDEYLKAYGENYVKKYVAYPGFSEHQTGLSVDIKASSSNTFANTKEAKWVKENAYKYGFIERYTKKMESITGYQSELWHYRYVGVEIATYIKQNNISFDEYWVKFLRDK